MLWLQSQRIQGNFSEIYTLVQGPTILSTNAEIRGAYSEMYVPVNVL